MVNPWWAVPTAIAAFLAGRRPGRTGPVVLTLVATVAAGVVAVSVVPAWLPLGSRFVVVVVFAAMLPWFAGRFRRQYQELVRAGWERAEQLRREQELVAEQARLRERARIAQDMHDVLGHDLSLIALSAGALKLAPDLDEHHRRATGDIRARAAAAVERLGEVIGVLREGADDSSAQPVGSGGAHTTIADLTAEAAASGLAVELRVDGTADDFPPAVERAAHRVVREALTNVARHTPGASATVHVTHTATETRVKRRLSGARDEGQGRTLTIVRVDALGRPATTTLPARRQHVGHPANHAGQAISAFLDEATATAMPPICRPQGHRWVILSENRLSASAPLLSVGCTQKGGGSADV